MLGISFEDEESDVVTRNGKIKRNSDELILPVHPAEVKYRKSHSIEDVIKEYAEDITCANCGNDLIQQIKDGEDVQRHPCLSVLVCETCLQFYNSGGFSVDSDEEEQYCRWCGNGGKLLVCSKCVCGFCAECIKRNFGAKIVRDIRRDDDWLCLLCEPSPLWHLRQVTDLALEHARKVRQIRREKRRQRIKQLKEKKLKKLNRKPNLAPKAPDRGEPRQKRRRIRIEDSESSSGSGERNESPASADMSYSRSPSPALLERSQGSERSNSWRSRTRSGSRSSVPDSKSSTEVSEAEGDPGSAFEEPDWSKQKEGRADKEETAKQAALADSSSTSDTEDQRSSGMTVPIDKRDPARQELTPGKQGDYEKMKNILKSAELMSSIVKKRATKRALLCSQAETSDDLQKGTNMTRQNSSQLRTLLNAAASCADAINRVSRCQLAKLKPDNVVEIRHEMAKFGSAFKPILAELLLHAQDNSPEDENHQ